jgi:hypothetical protein
MTVTQGSRWTSSDHKTFIVLHQVEVDGYQWVHYREDCAHTEPREYSCYLDSFLLRFKPHVN